MSDAFIRAKRPDGSECTIDLIELETALDLGGWQVSRANRALTM